MSTDLGHTLFKVRISLRMNTFQIRHGSTELYSSVGVRASILEPYCTSDRFNRTLQFSGGAGRQAAPAEIRFSGSARAAALAEPEKRSILGGLTPSKPPGIVKQKPQVLNHA